LPPSGRQNALVYDPDAISDIRQCVVSKAAPGCPVSQCNDIRRTCREQCRTGQVTCLDEVESCLEACHGDRPCEQACNLAEPRCEESKCGPIFDQCPVHGCSESFQVSPTQPDGVRATVVMGNELDSIYHVEVSAQTGPARPLNNLTFEYGEITLLDPNTRICVAPISNGSTDESFVTSPAWTDQQGHVVDAAAAGNA